MARRTINVFNLSFLDAMTCGFGAVVLLFMVIGSRVQTLSAQATQERRAEVDRLDEQILESHENLVEIRNSLREIEDRRVEAHGLSTQIIEQTSRLQLELATADDSTLARTEHINKLKTDLESLDTSTKRLSAAGPSDQIPGTAIRSFVGDGDRQYLTGLKVGGKRILILVDASASMLAATVVNVLRRRNLPDSVKIQADKWQRAVSTVDWLTTQIPRDSRFQIYTFNETARPVVSGTEARWLDGSDRAVLDRAVATLKEVVPRGGTNLLLGLRAIRALHPAPDNLILLTDGLPTQGSAPVRGGTVSGKKRMKLFREAVAGFPAQTPVNVILFPMEGDPLAASSFWRLAVDTHGSFLSPPEDWP